MILVFILAISLIIISLKLIGIYGINEANIKTNKTIIEVHPDYFRPAEVDSLLGLF